MFENADKMFEELGFEKRQFNNEIIYSYNERLNGEIFNNLIKFALASKIVIPKTALNKPLGLSIPELKAINQKCKELGWLNV